MEDYAVVLANDLVVKASNFGGIKNLKFNKQGKVTSFTFEGQKTVALFQFKSNEFLDYVDESYFEKTKEKEIQKEGNKYDGVDKKLWESFIFKKYDKLVRAQIGDKIFGLLRDSSGLCYNYHTWIYTNSYNGPRNPQLAPEKLPTGQLCDTFVQGTHAKDFFDTYKTYVFLDTEESDIRLIGEIASLLKTAGEKTAEAFLNFNLTGVDTTKFTFHNNQNQLSRDEFLEYKRGLELWLKILKKYQIEISKLDHEEQLFIAIDVMYRHNMLTLLTVEQRISILKILVEKRVLMNWYFENFTKVFHKEDLAIHILESFTNASDADLFLEKLISINVIESEYKDHQGVILDTKYVTLYKMLFYRMDDYFGKDNFTRFAFELNRIVLLKNGIIQSEDGILISNPENLKPINQFVKYNFIWNKRYNKVFKGEVDYSITYPSISTIKIKEKICKEVVYESAHGIPVEYATKFYENEVVLNHFDLVSISYLSNPSFIDLCEYGDCSNQTFLASAGFIDYLLEKQDTKMKLEVLSRSLQTLSLAFGVGELLVAIRTGNLIRGLIGAYTIAGDIYSYVISSPAFIDYLQEAYPDDHQSIRETLDMIGLLNGLTNAGVAIGYSAYNINQATKFIGEVEALEWNPAAIRRMTTPEVNALQTTREKLLAEMYVLRRNANTNKIIEDEIRAYRDYRNLHIDKAIRGTMEEWELARQTILEYRALGNGGGNFGYLEGNINGYSLNNLLDTVSGNRMFRSVSSDFANEEPFIFTALTVTWSRNTDSEYRMLNKLALLLKPNAKLGEKYFEFTGTLKIISENAYCTSCQGIIQQFNNMFPEINIVLIDATKL